jgi:NMD protein affecting ribosome stability and mRNA decay
MKCSQCGEYCVGIETGDSIENLCSDCAFFKKPTEDEVEAASINHWRQTGEFVDGNELLRQRKKFLENVC